jgi:hypothetical protein
MACLIVAKSADIHRADAQPLKAHHGGRDLSACGLRVAIELDLRVKGRVRGHLDQEIHRIGPETDDIKHPPCVYLKGKLHFWLKKSQRNLAKPLRNKLDYFSYA